MVNISKLGDSTIKFTFTDNDRYLYNGEITLPLNSLILEFDTSDLVIFKKIDGDVFVTFLLENSNFNSKDELIAWYKANMVGSTGGGGGDITSGEVQTMIDESISGKANSSDVYTTGQTSGATEIANALNAKLDATAYTPTDLSEYWTSAQTSSAIDEATSGKTNQSDFTAYTASTDAALSGKVDSEDLDISGKTLEKVYTFSDGNDFSGFSLSSITIHYNSNIPMYGMKVLLRAKNASDNWAIPILTLNANESGITEYYVSETGDVSDKFAFSIVNGDLIATITDNDFKIVSFAYAYPTAQQNSLYSFIVPSEIESGSTPSVIEEGVYDTLESLSNSVNALKKSNTTYEATSAYNNSVTYPSLSYTTSGITLNYSFLTGGTIHTSLSTDASIDDDKGVLGVYASGATHSVTLNLERKTDRINFIPKSNLVFKASLNQSYTGTLPTQNAIQIRYKDFDSDYSYKQGYWDYNSGTDSFSWTTNPSYVNNTGVSMSYDSVSKVLTFTIDPSIVDTYGNFRFTCSRYITPASALTQADCFIGLIEYDTNSYKLQEALDNKQDTLSAGTNITISGNVISANDVQVSSAITENDTNPVAGGVLYDELRIGGETEITLEWENYDGGETTNYPSGSGCSKITFEVAYSGETEDPYNTWVQEEGYFNVSGINGYIHIAINNGVVTASAEDGFPATCSVNGNIVTVEYPTIAEDVEMWYSSYDNHWTTKAILGGTPVRVIDQVTANTASISDKVDTSSVVTAVTSASTDSQVPSAKAVYDVIPTVDITLNSGSTNPVANSTLYGELRYDSTSEITLEWEYNSNMSQYETTNFPSGATSVTLTFTKGGNPGYSFYSNGTYLGGYDIGANTSSVNVYEKDFDSTYTTSGGSITISWDASKNVTTISCGVGDGFVGTTIVGGLIPLIDQVSAFTTHTADTSIHHTSTSAVTSGSTDVLTSGGAYEALGGLKIVKLTESEYAALSPNYDSNTVYFIGDSNGYTMKIGDVSVN